jgi:hypothetical protein
MATKAWLLVLLAAALLVGGAAARDGRAESGNADGIRFTIPPGWRAAPASLTPHLTNPREVLTVGTGALPVGGRCAQFPSAALAALGPTDGLVTVQERLGSVAGFPARPRRFSLPDPDTSEAGACAGPGATFTSYWFEFRDRGRGFHVLVAFGRQAPAARRQQALAILDSLRIGPAPFHERLHAAHFPRSPGWRTRISGPAADSPRCGKQRVSWASTVPFLDGPRQLPPHKMIAALAPDGIIIALTQYTDTCARLPGIRALRPPLDLGTAKRSGFPGPRGDVLPLYRIHGRFPGRYNLDLWVFYGRRHPTAAQRAAAQREVSRVRWPAQL